MRLLRAIVAASALLCAAGASAGEFRDRHPGDARYAAFEDAIDATKAAMMADPEHAMGKARIAIARADVLPASNDAVLARATAQWLQAESLIGVNKPDLARPIIAQALAAVERTGPDTKLHGDLIRSRATVAAMRGHVQDALSDYQRAFEIFRTAGVERSQAIVLQDIGQIYWEAQDYQRVLSYYSQSNEIYRDDPNFELSAHNNLGEVLRKLHRYRDAVREYEAALVLARKLKSPLLEVRILSNLAIAQVENGQPAAAERNIARALRLTQSGEAAGWKPFVLGAGAKAAAARGDVARAAGLLERMFADRDITATDLSYREFHELAAGVFERIGDQGRALAHMKAFQRLDAEARNLTTSTSSQLMAARFDFANQNLKIERQQARFRTTLLSGIIAAATIIAAILFVLYLSIRRSRNRLALSNVALEKALAAKTEFLATTSHEIRTPLNGILGMTQVMLANRRIDPDVIDQIKVVHGAGEAMRALVDDILDVAKMEAGEIEPQLGTVDLIALLGDAATMWRGHADGKGIALDLDLAQAPAAIRSDAGRLRQIVSNLLSNAVKFTPTGHVRLTVAAAGDTLTLAVADTGIGIAADQQALIFEPFHQIDGGMNRQFSGTGLGLAICRNLSRALGGDIAVASTPGAGSTFTVTLPLVVAEATPARAPAASLAEARLLLVEGNLLAQGMLGTLLEPHAGGVSVADDAAAALPLLAHADHLLVDARASGRAGEEATLADLRALVEAGRRAGLRVSILVAPSDAFPLGDVAMLGADQVIVKPVGGKQLIAALHEPYAQAEPPARADAAAA